MTYNPNEPRDERGRWTGTGPHPSGVAVAVLDPNNVAKADEIARIAADTARKLDFDPKFITVSDESKQFTLNGEQRNYAGQAFLDMHTDRPDIAIYTPHVTAETAHGVTAHEIEHQKYQAFMNDYRKEYEALRSDPDYHKDTTWVPYDSSNPSHVNRKDAGEIITTDNKIREFGFMRPDGLLNDPYASRYPTYQAWTKANMPMSDKFAKTDGVSGYSRDWWNAYEKREVQLPQAMHETLAELARVRHETRLRKEDHERNVAYIKEHGGTWTAADESEWKKHLSPITHIVRKSNGMLTTRKGIDPIWNDLYKAVEENWKRRNKK